MTERRRRPAPSLPTRLLPVADRRASLVGRIAEWVGRAIIEGRLRPRVAAISLEEVREVYEVRAGLGAMVAERVARTAPAAAIAVLREHYEQMAKAAGESALDSLGLRTLQLRHLSMAQPERLARSSADHERLMRAYEGRDAALAAALNRSIILDALAAIERSGWSGVHQVPSEQRPA